MKIREVSKRYAKALLTVAKQKGAHAKVLAELTAVSQAFSSDKAIKEFFENPTVTPEQKISALKGALGNKGLSDEVMNTLLLLSEKGRLDTLPEMVEAFGQALDDEQGVTRGTVRSAKQLSQDDQKNLEAKIHKVLNKKIILTYQEDPKLLGGIVAQVGGWTFDDSIQTHLKKLNEELNRRAN
jgi:F-type H+-transporting ATPase subunit delta